jgi:hypothetical protein
VNGLSEWPIYANPALREFPKLPTDEEISPLAERRRKYNITVYSIEKDPVTEYPLFNLTPLNIQFNTCPR